MTTDLAYTRALAEILKRANVTARKRVKLGFAWLQEHRPGWHRFISLEEGHFAMDDGRACIWGQLAAKDLEDWFGPLDLRPRALDFADCANYLRHNLVGMDDDKSYLFMRTHGFSVGPGDADHVTHAMLQEQWVPLIRGLQEADGAEAQG